MPNLRPIRRNQLISPFGVGATVDFRGDESLMTAGLDEWPLAKEECPADWLIREERLEAKLGVTHFRLPPDYREPGQGIEHANQFVPYVRFPRWHYCPRRGAMEFLPLYGGREKCRCRAGLDCFALPEKRRPFLIPMRFVAVCPKGHIEDFPFMEWVHRGTRWDASHKLRMLAGRSSANLSGIKISCSCGKSESMTGSFNFEQDTGGALHRLGHDCSGDQPWIGKSTGMGNQCGEYLRVVQRGASNVYFPVTHSSIYIPLWGEGNGSRINKLLETPKVWESLIAGLDEGKYVQHVRSEVVAMNYQVDADELRAAAQRKLDGERVDSAIGSKSDEEFRRQEYDALKDARGGPTTSLLVQIRGATEYDSNLSTYFDRVGLVSKLRETRVLAGFSRLLPVEDNSRADLLPVAESSLIRWLPATVVYGEGLFLQFNANRLATWLATAGVADRIAELSNRYNRRRIQRGLAERRIVPKYVLLHTFAHLLITQLAFDCGYGSASLRERIYCDADDPTKPMEGVLIYTASGDSEGTLGGLVRQAQPDRLPAIVLRALSRAQWCSSDPVCIESHGQGSDNANLAACHGCVLVPETSCEQGNRLLDRGLLIGTPRERSIGYFGDISAIPP